MKRLALVVFACSIVLLSACTYYQAAPGTNSGSGSSVSKFDQSWSATVGAFSDQGVRITSEDRNAGVVQGARNGILVTADVRQQADGSVRVQFDTSGDKSRDPGLMDRITRSYQRRMGR